MHKCFQTELGWSTFLQQQIWKQIKWESLYGSETWVMTMNDKSIVHILEIKIYIVLVTRT
jgi:hypothetical protein